MAKDIFSFYGVSSHHTNRRLQAFPTKYFNAGTMAKYRQNQMHRKLNLEEIAETQVSEEEINQR